MGVCPRAFSLQLAQRVRSAWGLAPARGLALGSSPNSAATCGGQQEGSWQEKDHW